MFGAIAGGIASALAGGAMSKLFGGGQKAASGGIQGDVLATDNNTVGMGDRKSGSAGMPRPISYAVFCLKKKKKKKKINHILILSYKSIEIIEIQIVNKENEW